MPTKILLQTVGTGRDPNPNPAPKPPKPDPGNPVWEALAFTVQEIKPDRLIQLCSEKTARETIPKFLAEVGTLTTERHEITSPDPDDVEKLAFQYGEELDRLRREFPEAEFYADYTSGTKPMSAALLAAAISRGIPQVCYATGIRDAGGRVTQTTGLQTLHTGERQADYLATIHFAQCPWV